MTKKEDFDGADHTHGFGDVPDDFWENEAMDIDEPIDTDTDNDEEEINPFVAAITVDTVVENGEKSANVYVDGYTHEDFLMGNLKATSLVKKILIARVTKTTLETWPINLKPDKADYLQPKYENLRKITMFRSGRSSWSIPEDADEFEYTLSRLPTGFSRRAQYGLGLKWEYRHIFDAISSIPSVQEMLMPDGDGTSLDGTVYTLGMERFEALRRGIDTIGRRYQREALTDKRLLVYSNLLTIVDENSYPVRTKEIKPGALYELVKLGSRQSRTPGDRKAALDVVKAESKELAKANPAELMSLKATIELVTLEKLIEKFEVMMTQKLTEAKWQKFFESNPFILSLAFAHPIFMIQSHAFVGGTTLRGVGEKIADFLFKNHYSGNLALIEIKRPDTSLLTKNAYRTDLYGPDKHLASAISQVLDQRYHLQTNFASKVYDSGLRDVHPFAIQCIVLIGTTPQSDKERKSLELFRNASKDVVVITFDEMLAKLHEIRRVMGAGSTADVGTESASVVDDSLSVGAPGWNDDDGES